MAIIQTIRDKYAKAAGGLIVVALIGFVLMDLGKGGLSGSTVAAKVEGQKIDIQDFMNYSNERIEQQKQQNPNQPMTDFNEEQLRDEAWNEMLSDVLFENWKSKMGVVVTAGEFKEMFAGVNADPNMKQMFINPETGEFDMEQAILQYNELENTTDPQMKSNWLSYKESMKKMRWQNKVGKIVTASLFTPSDVLDFQYEFRLNQANVELLQLPFTMISDDQVAVSEEEIDAYIKDNKDKFKAQAPLLEMDVIQIPMVPGVADSTMFYTKMDSIKTEFATIENPEEYASLVSGQTIVAQTYTKDILASLPNSEELMDASVGSVVGPFYLQESQYALARIMDKEQLPDSVDVRHILVTVRDQSGAELRTKEEAKVLIDSLVAAIKGGANFDTLALNFSDDEGSKNNGGKYTFTAGQKGSLTKNFGDFAFSGATGSSNTVYVEQNYEGYHYIEIVKRSSTTQSASKMVLLFQNLEIGEETKREINNKANQFAVDASKGGQSFDMEVQKLGLNKFPVMANPNSKLLGSLGVSGEMVAWAQKANIGDVSPIVIMDNNYVIATLKGRTARGEVTDAEQLRKDVENVIRNKKKAEMLLQQYEGKGDLNAISAQSGQTPTVADSVSFFGSVNPVLNSEPKVLGYIFAPNTQTGQVSKGIPGRQGVYFVVVGQKFKVTPEEPRDIAVERKMAVSYIANPYRYYMAAKTQEAKIEDMRYKFINRL